MHSFIVVASLTLALLLHPASCTPAENLVVNGGFETNSGVGSQFITDWNNVGGAGWYPYNLDSPNTYSFWAPVDAGTYSVVPNSYVSTDPGILSQDITTTAGDCYIVSFDYTTNELTGDLGFSWSFGSNPSVTLPLTSLTSKAFVTWTSSPLPGTGTDTLAFSCWNGGGGGNNGQPALDQVSVVLAPDYVYDESQDACILMPVCDSMYDDCMSGVTFVTDCCNNNGGTNCDGNGKAYAGQCVQALTAAASCTTLDCCESTFASVTGVSTDTAVAQQDTCGGFSEPR